MKLPETIRAAFVIARRDFTATVLSKTFLFFLLGPLFPIALGFGFVGIGAQVERSAKAPPVAVIASKHDFELLTAARTRLVPLADATPLVELRYERPEANLAAQRARLLAAEQEPVIGVLEGGLAAPRLSGTVTARTRAGRQVGLYIEEARRMAVQRPVEGQALRSNADQKYGRAGGFYPQRDSPHRSDASVRPHHPACRHAAVAIDRGEIEQGDRGAGSGGAGRRHFPRQIVRNARHVAGRHYRLGQRRRAGRSAC